MTFSELVTLTRREIIADLYDDAYSDERLLDALWESSVQLAAAFDMPVIIQTLVIGEGATTIATTGMRKVLSLSIAGDDAQSTDIQTLMRVMELGSRPVRYYNYDPRRGDFMYVSPPSVGGTAIIEAVAALTKPVSVGPAEPWDGVLPQFHHVIAYRAAAALFQMDERESEAGYFQQEYQSRVSEMAAFLGRTTLGNLVIPPEARNDEGARG